MAIQMMYTSGVMVTQKYIKGGAAAQTWPMKMMGMSGGRRPNKTYRVTKAQIWFDVFRVNGAGKHIVVTRESGEQLGDIPITATGSQSHELLTTPNYDNIKSIKIDSGEGDACQLRSGSMIRLIVTLEEYVPQVVAPAAAPEPVVITGVETTEEKGKALRTEVAVSFDGVDISKAINEYLLSLSYTDNEEDEADDLQIKLEDVTKIWLGHWLDDTLNAAAYGIKNGSKGLTISAGVKQMRPNGRTIKSDFGFFELDQIRASGPPSNILIKGTSLPYSNGIRTEDRDKSWEGYTLSRIGQEIASKGGLGFLFDSPDDPSYGRVEQANQTDIAFLSQLCHDAGKSLKISGLKLIIFDQARYESLEAVTTIKWMDETYIKYDLNTQDGDTHYDKCTVSYYDAVTDSRYEATVDSEDFDPESNEYTVCTVTNRKVSSNDEAKELAAKILRLHNKYEKRVTFTMIGNPMLGAGLTVTLSGFGMWDEKYIIKQCRHEISNSGYVTKITLRSIPEGKVTNVKIEEEEEVAEEAAPATGQTTTTKKKQTQKAWYTDAIVKVYDGKEGSAGTRWIGSDVEVKVLGNTSGNRTLIQYGNVQGYVDTASLSKKDKKTDTKKK